MIPQNDHAKVLLSFEWSHFRILPTDCGVTTTIHVATIDSVSERNEFYPN